MKLLLEIPEVLKANFEHDSFKSILNNKDLVSQEDIIGYPHISAEKAREIDGTAIFSDKEAEYMILAHQMLIEAFENAIIVEEDTSIQIDLNNKENSIYLKGLDCENYKILTFSLDKHTYTLNPNLKENRDLVKQEINSNSKYKWDWFKEKTGNRHWVLFNTDMYEIGVESYEYNKPIQHLHYKEDSCLTPELPINCSSCYFMFSNLITLTSLNFSKDKFNTEKIVNMCGMFTGCINLEKLDVSSFNTSNVYDMEKMFCNCQNLKELKLTNFSTTRVREMQCMFNNCCKLKELNLTSFNTKNVFTFVQMFAFCYKLSEILISDCWCINDTEFGEYVFTECYSLPNFKSKNIDLEMAKPIEDGGYLTLVE